MVWPVIKPYRTQQSKLIPPRNLTYIIFIFSSHTSTVLSVYPSNPYGISIDLIRATGGHVYEMEKM